MYLSMHGRVPSLWAALKFDWWDKCFAQVDEGQDHPLLLLSLFASSSLFLFMVFMVRDMTFVHFVFMRGGMCVHDEAVWCALVVCAGLRDGMIGCVSHVNALGCLGVIHMASLGKAGGVVEQLEFVGAVRVGAIGVELKLRAVGARVGTWWYWCRVSARRRQTIVVSASVRVERLNLIIVF